jgi:uncharacterized membrane protein YhaH (DUF805 family)
MSFNNPVFLSIFVFVFILLAFYNVVLGVRRMREAAARNQPVRWYRQLNLLTGIEYTFLALVFLLSMASRNGNLSSGLKQLIVPIYLLLLVGAAVFAGLVIRQGISNARNMRRQAAAPAAKSNGTVRANGNEKLALAEEDDADTQQVANLQRRRERRRNAAAARRRRAGKA